MMRRRTSAAALVATLAVLTCVAVSGCRAGSDEAPYPEVTAQIGPPSMPAEEEPPLPPQEQPLVTRLPVPTGNPPEEAPPPLPPQEQPPEMSVPAPPEAPPHGMVVVPTVPLGADEEPAETEFLTSGPVHEAFAEPVDLQPEPGLLVPEEPPADIDEVPPAERPEGADIAWVAGYWAWDDDRAGYIWVSGCWRAAPPGMRWEPGYWAAVPGGWQWVSGYWQQVSVQTVVYLPQAPPFDDLEPPGPAPAEDTVWVPPCHYWLRGRYVLRRGYWLTLRDGWVWVPSHYVWTPHGYVFIPGHWDLALYRRGVLFAPAYFPRFVYARRAFSYSPIIVVDLALLTGDLFVYPRYCHYFFGDYYDDIYLRVGIYPWCDSIRVRRWYDPIYVYDRWRHRRSDPRWDQHQRDEYDRRRADTHHRPPRTYREMEKGLAEMPDSERHGHRLARPLASVVSGHEGPRRFVRISDDETRRRIAREATDARSTREEREGRGAVGEGPRAGRPGPSARGQVSAPPARGRGAPSPTRGGRTAPTPEPGAGVTPTPPREPVVAPPARGGRAAPPEETRGRATPPRGTRGQVGAPRGTPEPVVSPREPAARGSAPRGGRQPSPPPEPRSVEPPGRSQEGARGGRGSTVSAEQLRLQQWAREQQAAADRQKQQREQSAEQARQQRWARDQQEAADRQRQQEQAAQRARQRQQQDQQRRQQQDEQRRRQEQDRSRSRSDRSGGSSQDSSGDSGGGGRGRGSGRR